MLRIRDSRWMLGSLALAAAAAPAALAQEMYFSLDIGSDKEISDPFRDGNEGADPGDLYRSEDLPGGVDGTHPPADSTVLDDSRLFGFDPFPVQYDLSYGSAVPIGSGCGPACFASYFNMDAADVVARAPSFYGVDPLTPLAVPVRKADFPDHERGCIYDASFLAVSYNDDHRRNWSSPSAPRVPVEGPSPAGETYGTSDGDDEIVSFQVGSGGSYPFSITAIGSIADEELVHPDLAPNPDLSESDDDDIDALAWDSIDSGCDIFLFSVDHTAHNGLSPGALYSFGGAGVVAVEIQAGVHLGLDFNTDIDAFELAWIPDFAAAGELSLAMLFSVAQDDPGSGVDESGGLDPGVVYASFLDGASFVYTSPLNGIVYGIEGDISPTPGRLHVIDPLTGASTVVGDTGADSQCLAADSLGRVFTLDGADLLEVNPSDPAASTVLTTVSGLTGDVLGATFDDSDTLYVIVDAVSGSALYTIDVDTGIASPVGATGDTGLSGLVSLAYDDATATLYAANAFSNELCTLSLVDGSATVLGGTGLVSEEFCLEVLGDHELYCGDQNLTWIDRSVTPPAGTIVGPFGATDHMHGMAFVELPYDDIDAIAVGESAFHLRDTVAVPPSTVRPGGLTGPFDIIP